MTEKEQELNRFEVAGWTIEPLENRMFNGQEAKSLRPKLIEVLHYLATHRGRVVSKQELLAHVWGETIVDDAIVKKSISQIRKDMGEDPKSPQILLTVARRGYQCIAPVHFPSADASTNQHDCPLPNDERPPYRALDVFDTQDSAFFFGRDTAIQTVIDNLNRQGETVGPFTLVVGASGSGKSSLILAGVIPSLVKHYPQYSWKFMSLRQELYQANPLESLVKKFWNSLYPAATNVQHDDFDTLVQELNNNAQSTVDTLLKHLDKQQNSNSTKESRFFLFLDQLEGLFSQSLSKEFINHFFDVLHALVNSQKVWIVAAIRSDFYSECIESDSLRALKQGSGHFDLTTPTVSELKDIISQPAERAGICFDTDPITGQALDDRLLEEMIQFDAGLPLLEFTLSELYRQRTDNTLTFETYAAIGGLGGSLSQHAESLYQRLPAKAQAAFSTVFHQLTRFSAGQSSQVAQSPSQWAAFADDEHAIELVNTFIEGRLFVSDRTTSNFSTISLSHEALFSHWKRLKEWVQDNIDLLKVKQRLAYMTEHWVESGKKKQFDFLRVSEVDSITSLHQKNIALNEDESEFIRLTLGKKKQQKAIRLGIGIALLTLSFTSIFLTAATSRALENEQLERAAAEQTTDFFVGIFRAADPTTELKGETPIRTFLELGLEDIKQSSGEQYSLKIRSLLTLGQTYHSLGEYPKALEAYKLGLDIYESNKEVGDFLYEELNDSIGETYSITRDDRVLQHAKMLANYYSKKNKPVKLADSKVYLAKALNIHRATIYWTDKTPEEIQLLKEAEQIYQANHVTGKPLADVYLELARDRETTLAENTNYFNRAYAIYVAEDQKESAKSLEIKEVAGIDLRTTCPTVALKIHVPNLQKISSVYGESHRLTGKSTLNLALTYFTNEMPAEAEPLFIRASEIYKEKLGTLFGGYQYTQLFLINRYITSNRHTKAHELINQALKDIGNKNSIRLARYKMELLSFRFLLNILNNQVKDAKKTLSSIKYIVSNELNASNKKEDYFLLPHTLINAKEEQPIGMDVEQINQSQKTYIEGREFIKRALAMTMLNSFKDHPYYPQLKRIFASNQNLDSACFCNQPNPFETQVCKDAVSYFSK